MPDFMVTVGNKKFKVNAPSKDALPEIVETIASSQGSGGQNPRQAAFSQGEPPRPSMGEIVKRNFVDAGLGTINQAAAIVNSAALGLPEAGFQKFLGRNFVNPDRPSFEGRLMGAALGAPGKLAGAAFKAVPTGLKSITAGAVGGAVTSPQEIDPNAGFTDLRKRGVQAAGGAVAGAATAPVASLVSTFAKLNPKRQVQFARNVRKQFHDVKKGLVQQFDDSLESLAKANPEKKISLRSVVEGLNFDEVHPTAKNALRSSPKFRKLLDDVDLSDSVTIREAQEIANELNVKVPANIKRNHFEILDTINDVKAAQLEAFPEMAAVRARYAEKVQPFNDVKTQFRFNRLLKAIGSDFGGPEGKAAVKKLLPPQTIKEIGGLRNAMKFMGFIKKHGFTLGLIGAGGAAGAAGLSAFRGNQ